jgi:hypothetical protein
MAKLTLRKVEVIHLVREKRDERRQELAFKARPFLLCSLPLRRRSSDNLLYTR